MHRRRLGSKLRQLRENAGRTHREVAEWLDCSQGKISQIELGRVPVRASDVRLMAEFYGAAAEWLTSLEELARDSKQPGWWQAHPSTARRPGFDTYLGLETAAQAVSCFSADSVPELLRTVDYGRALLGELDAADTSDRLAVTSTRQQRLLGERPLELWAVLDEAVLRRVVGGPAVMRSQLEYLVLMSYRRNVTLRVLPLDADEHALSGDRVTVFSFSNPADPQVVHLGDSVNSRFLDKPGETEPYLTSFDRVCAAALTTRDSANLISTIADGRSKQKPGSA